MREAAGYLVGDHDYRNFCKADVAQVRPTPSSVFASVAVLTAARPFWLLTLEDSVYTSS